MNYELQIKISPAVVNVRRTFSSVLMQLLG